MVVLVIAIAIVLADDWIERVCSAVAIAASLASRCPATYWRTGTTTSRKKKKEKDRWRRRRWMMMRHLILLLILRLILILRLRLLCPGDECGGEMWYVEMK